MFRKKPVLKFNLAICFLALCTVVLISCSGSETKTTTTDSSEIKTDTTALDSASTRPVKGPN
jgi:hypothetical protein